MRHVTTNELLALNKFLQMETNSLAMAKVSIKAVSDGQLKTLYEAGITAAEGRVRGLQQFIAENDVLTTQNAYNPAMVSPAVDSANIDNNLPKGVM